MSVCYCIGKHSNFVSRSMCNVQNELSLNFCVLKFCTTVFAAQTFHGIAQVKAT